jgi:23S rRNA pseudouridine1911/1915/1917 synthase
MHKECIVPAGNSGERLDVFLVDCFKDFSRTKLQRLIENGLVLVNGEKARKNARLFGGDKVDVIDIESQATPRQAPTPQQIPLEILHEDDYLLAINKPAGMVVHPGHGNTENTMVNALLYYGSALSKGSALERPGIVHRLDKDTSGIILVAKTDVIHAQLCRMFMERTIEKIYIL